MDHRHTFLTTQGHGGPPRMSDQPNAGATSETAQTWKTIHTKHTRRHPNKANIEWWLRRDGLMIFGDLGGLKFPDICLTGEKKTRKNLTQETCPDRGSNPGPLHDKRACYHLLHSGGHDKYSFHLSLWWCDRRGRLLFTDHQYRVEFWRVHFNFVLHFVHEIWSYI